MFGGMSRAVFLGNVQMFVSDCEFWALIFRGRASGVNDWWRMSRRVCLGKGAIFWAEGNFSRGMCDEEYPAGNCT